MTRMSTFVLFGSVLGLLIFSATAATIGTSLDVSTFGASPGGSLLWQLSAVGNPTTFSSGIINMVTVLNGSAVAYVEWSNTTAVIALRYPGALKPAWVVNITGKPKAPDVFWHSDQTALYMTTYQGGFYALSLQTGEQLWSDSVFSPTPALGILPCGGVLTVDLQVVTVGSTQLPTSKPFFVNTSRCSPQGQLVQLLRPSGALLFCWIKQDTVSVYNATSQQLLTTVVNVSAVNVYTGKLLLRTGDYQENAAIVDGKTGAVLVEYTASNLALPCFNSTPSGCQTDWTLVGDADAILLTWSGYTPKYASPIQGSMMLLAGSHGAIWAKSCDSTVTNLCSASIISASTTRGVIIAQLTGTQLLAGFNLYTGASQWECEDCLGQSYLSQFAFLAPTLEDSCLFAVTSMDNGADAATPVVLSVARCAAGTGPTVPPGPPPPPTCTSPGAPCGIIDGHIFYCEQGCECYGTACGEPSAHPLK